MVDLSLRNLNFLSEILVQMKALYREISNEINGVGGQGKNKVRTRADGKARQGHTPALDEQSKSVRISEAQMGQPIQQPAPLPDNAVLANKGTASPILGVEGDIAEKSYGLLQYLRPLETEDELLRILDGPEKRAAPQPCNASVPAS
jgi:hypothetical protein